MKNDPLVEEIHRIREEYAREFDFDLDRIVKDLQERQRRSGKTLVRREPKRIPMTATASDDKN